jgi:hypothetical protein
VNKGLEGCPGVFLGGNYVSGVAFGDCVQWGVDTAPKVADFLALSTVGEKAPATV